jgi:diguanylate cyclase (GGDEF)-like protein
MVEEETKTLQEAYRDLLGAINTDPLTGLESRASLDQKLKIEHQRFQRFGRPYALIILDLDNLKEVNDTWGHATGDTVLQLVAKAAKDRLRVTDTAARWGGDEFVLLLPETPLEDAAGVARDIQEGMTRQQEKISGIKKAPSAWESASFAPESRRKSFSNGATPPSTRQSETGKTKLSQSPRGEAPRKGTSKTSKKLLFLRYSRRAFLGFFSNTTPGPTLRALTLPRSSRILQYRRMFCEK